MKIRPPFLLAGYITFKDDRVVAKKPIPKILQKSFDKYCEKVDNANSSHERMFDEITKSIEKARPLGLLNIYWAM